MIIMDNPLLCLGEINRFIRRRINFTDGGRRRVERNGFQGSCKCNGPIVAVSAVHAYVLISFYLYTSVCAGGLVLNACNIICLPPLF